MPKRIQLSRSKGWRMPETATKVDRSTRWGNPFKVGERYGWAEPDSAEVEGPFTPIKDAAEAVSVYRSWLEDQHDLIDAARRELRGRDLACWCKSGEPCHADVLLKISNE